MVTFGKMLPMKSALLIITFICFSTYIAAQAGDFEGKVRVSEMDVDNQSNDLVVRQSNGTLAQRSANSLIGFTVSLTGDTLYQGNSGWVIIPGISNANTVTYRVTFESFWSAATHPVDFPVNPHFSGLIGMTHNMETELFVRGGMATTGIENMAETGSKTALINEINTKISQGSAQSVVSGGGIGNSPGSVFQDFTLTNTHPFVSIVTMIAPSPDWFVAVKDVNLFQNGNWVENLVVDVSTYDSGTDSGFSYSSGNQDTVPPIPIHLITSQPLANGFGVIPLMGTMTFERIDN